VQTLLGSSDKNQQCRLIAWPDFSKKARAGQSLQQFIQLLNGSFTIFNVAMSAFVKFQLDTTAILTRGTKRITDHVVSVVVALGLFIERRKGHCRDNFLLGSSDKTTPEIIVYSDR
jgi:hypothetical protein